MKGLVWENPDINCVVITDIFPIFYQYMYLFAKQGAVRNFQLVCLIGDLPSYIYSNEHIAQALLIPSTATTMTQVFSSRFIINWVPKSS